MPLSREHCAVPQFDVGYTVPPSRPRSNPPPCTTVVKSLPSHCDPTGRRQAGARPCSFPSVPDIRPGPRAGSWRSRARWHRPIVVGTVHHFRWS